MSSSEEIPQIKLDQSFSWGGIQLQYPGYWEIQQSNEGGHLSVTVLTEQTAFWMLTVIQDDLTVEEILNSALQSFQDEYDEVDVYEPDTDEVNHWVTQELDLVYQELITSVVLKVLPVKQGALFVLYQGQDIELDMQRPVFEEITNSIRLDVDLFS